MKNQRVQQQSQPKSIASSFSVIAWSCLIALGSSGCGDILQSAGGLQSSGDAQSGVRSMMVDELFSSSDLAVLSDPLFEGAIIDTATSGDQKKIWVKAMLRPRLQDGNSRSDLIALLEDVEGWKTMQDDAGEELYTDIFVTDKQWKKIKNQVDGKISKPFERRYVSGTLLIGEVPLLPDQIFTNFYYDLSEEDEVIVMNQVMVDAFFKLGFVKTSIIGSGDMKVKLVLAPEGNNWLAYSEISIVSKFSGLIEDQKLESGTTALISWLNNNL